MTTPTTPIIERSILINDHIKIEVAQTVKGARVTVSLLQTDHDIDTAVKKAVAAYKQTLEDLKAQELKVDE